MPGWTNFARWSRHRYPRRGVDRIARRRKLAGLSPIRRVNVRTNEATDAYPPTR